MNGKKAKRIRQLVKHLATAGAIENKDWVIYGRQGNTQTVMMDPACGRAIYQKMKKHALHHRTGV